MGKLEDWIHIEAIQVITHHASAALVAVLVFGVMGRLITRLMPEGNARKVVTIIDDVVLILVLVIFGWELLVYLWGRHLSFLKRPPLIERFFKSSNLVSRLTRPALARRSL